MKRWIIEAKFWDAPKMKWTSLFKDQRTYKTEKGAKSVVYKEKQYRPELQFRIKEVDAKCPYCDK